MGFFCTCNPKTTTLNLHLKFLNILSFPRSKCDLWHGFKRNSEASKATKSSACTRVLADTFGISTHV